MITINTLVSLDKDLNQHFITKNKKNLNWIYVSKLILINFLNKILNLLFLINQDSFIHTIISFSFLFDQQK